MTFEEIKALDDRYIMHTYGRSPVAFVSGEGASLTDVNGKKYVDLTSGIGVNVLGHNHPALVEAVCSQAKKLMHVSNLYYTEPDVIAAKLICDHAGMAKVFFANSGAEANEGLIKLARKYSFDKYGANRNKIITLVNSFHGRTVMTLEATGQEKFHNYFFPFTGGFLYAEANDIEDFKAKLSDEVCAFLVEPVQGESGIRPLDKEYLAEAAAICREKDILFLCDEVQTGMGHTGTLFAFEQLGVKPDAFSMAKGLAGGVPIGCVAASEKCADVLGAGSHGSTFGGNPLAAAAAGAVLKTLLEPGFLDEVKAKGEYLKNGILAMNLPAVKEVRGMGLMLGIAVDPEKRAGYVSELLKRGVVVLTAGTDAIRLLPPLVITKEEIDTALAAFKEVLGS